MTKHTSPLVALLTGALGLAALPSAAQTDPTIWLLDQIHLGEMLHRDDLASNSMYRLKKIAPTHPKLLAAEIRLALRQQHVDEGQSLLAQLQQVSPESDDVQQMRYLISMQQPAVRQQIQRARLAALGGRNQDAWQMYQAAWHNQPPTVDDAVEYWRVAARLPGQHTIGLQKLQALLQQEPQNLAAWQGLVLAYFEFEQTPAAFQMLDQMASDPLLRADAAKLWWPHISQLPATEASRHHLQQFIARFANLPEADAAQKLLAHYDTTLADPAYRARLRGLSLLTENAADKAIPELLRALKATPNDPFVLGGLGHAYQQTGHRDIADLYYRQAMANDQGVTHQEWVDLQASNQYWWLIDQGNQLLQQKNIAAAQKKFQIALPFDAKSPYALIGLGDVAFARQEPEQAERYYRQAIARDRTNVDAQRALLNLFASQPSDKALVYLRSLPAGMQAQFQNLAKQLQQTQWRLEALQAQQQHQPERELSLLLTLHETDPSDIWVVFRIAQLETAQGNQATADALYRQALPQSADPVAAHYAYALFLSATDRDTDALQQLAKVPQAQWTDGMLALSQRLQQQALIAHARQLHAEGKLHEAERLLARAGDQVEALRLRASWQQEAGHFTAALALYEKLLHLAPTDIDGRQGKADVQILLGQTQAPRNTLASFQESEEQHMSLSQRRRLGNQWLQLNDTLAAQSVFARLRAQLEKQPNDAEAALAWRDIARASRQQGLSQQALAEDEHAMVAAGWVSQTSSAEEKTAATRIQTSDDWFARSLRSDYANGYQQQTTSVSLAQDVSHSSGTSGYSDNTTATTMLQLDRPFVEQGRSFFRMDVVSLNAGSLSADTAANHFGSCVDNSSECTNLGQQQDKGTSIAFGIDVPDQWHIDVGSTPIGFTETNWVGRAAVTQSWAQVKWTPYLSRRAMTNSLLSFAGATDPLTGQTWGGVMANNLGLDMSYDQGNRDGVWGSLRASTLGGDHVASNQREQWMGGYYYKLINRDDARLSVGLSQMWWHYQKDLSDYTWQNGGYYSPQHYVSVGLPITYALRQQDWSIELSTSLSRSWAETSTSSSAWGYSAQFVGEYRLTPHWFIGAKTTLQQSPDYSPANGLLYVRYAFQGWRGDLALPPETLTPYAEFE